MPPTWEFFVKSGVNLGNPGKKWCQLWKIVMKSQSSDSGARVGGFMRIHGCNEKSILEVWLQGRASPRIENCSETSILRPRCQGRSTLHIVTTKIRNRNRCKKQLERKAHPPMCFQDPLKTPRPPQGLPQPSQGSKTPQTTQGAGYMNSFFYRIKKTCEFMWFLT